MTNLKYLYSNEDLLFFIASLPILCSVCIVGDVGGIQMQVVPQTQFIPLPESLCLIIMDLNNNRIIATLDLIRERLAHCYGPDMQLPNDQLIYDTLGQLIRERKVFHTGEETF